MPENIKKPMGNDVEENKIFAALSYVWIMSIVILILKRDNPSGLPEYDDSIAIPVLLQ